ncbi:MAG: hypothetical protein KAV48_00990 [Methanomicrobia archaeon]|nr:hypothetical protein [Methanomicrobia archaeon]MCK4432486.1 hypothetical protein [Methanomicrobia archaeon]
MKKTTLEKLIGYIAVLFAMLYYSILVFSVTDVIFEATLPVEKFLIVSGFFLLASLHLIVGTYFLMLVYNSERIQNVISIIKEDILSYDEHERTDYEEKVIRRLRDLIE